MYCLLQKGLASFALGMFIVGAATIDTVAQRRSTRTAQGTSQNIDAKKLREASKESADAARVFTQILSAPDGGIPKELLDKAEAVAVFPGVIRAAFIVGGRGGDGVVSRRTAGGWSAPAFFNLGGGSFGAQIGASKTDIVLLFMNEGGLKGLLEDKFEIGGEAGVAAGPVGRSASASTNLTADAAILSYAKSKGAYIGAALKGVVINPDNNLNEAIYSGKKAGDILGEGSMNMAMTSAPAGVRVFPQTLMRYSARR
jgi:lipid-binding SYLF domain-containing protein